MNDMNGFPAPPLMPGSSGGASWRKKKIFIIVLSIGILIVLAVVVVFLTTSGILREGSSDRKATDAESRIDPIPSDRDRDGLSNDEEAAAGTSETEFDTDRDGLSDIDEMRVWKTDPKNPDTDGDGFGDGIEVVRGFNPAGPGELSR